MLTDIIISLFTLTLLEIILGVDNLVFISITSSRLPKEKQKAARRLGLTMAWVMRLVLLSMAFWLAHLTTPLFTLFDLSFSARDIFLLVGGLFLLVKATQEIHLELESIQEDAGHVKKRVSFVGVVTQIALFDMVFSLDSVLTAIGLTEFFWVMATAITIAILLMIFASEPLSDFVMKHPTVKMLALSFLILIGMALIADGLHFHVPRGYIYFAVCFSLLVEALNLYRRRKSRKKSV